MYGKPITRNNTIHVAAAKKEKYNSKNPGLTTGCPGLASGQPKVKPGVIKKKKGDSILYMKKRKPFELLLFVLLAVLLLASAGMGWKLYRYYADYSDDRDRYQELREEVIGTAADEAENDESDAEESEAEKATQETEEYGENVVRKYRRKKKRKLSKKVPITIDWEALKNINEDIIGWVYFTGLPQISYPILQADDNEYYVHRTYDLSSDTSKAGSIFMDYRMASDFSSPYSIIYGHNVRDGSMLSDLINLKDQQLYDEEPYFWILTPDGSYRYQIFSIFQCHRSADVFQRSFDRWGEDFSKWQSELKARNSMQGDVRLTQEGHVVVFSTCVPNSFDRTIVCGTYMDGDEIPDPHEDTPIISR